MGDSQRSVPPPSFNNSDLKVLGKINGKKASRKNVLGNIDESGPFPQPLPEASHDEAPSSGSLNVSMKSKGKNVDVSLCDESSSFSGPTKSRSYLISSILDEVKGKDIAKVEDVDLDDLMKDMSELLKLGEKDIRGPFKGLLTGTRSALPFVTPIDHCLERCDAVFTNRENCWHLIKEMYYLASFHKKLRENPKGMQDVMQEATALIFEGAPVCCAEIGRSAFRSFFSTLEIEGALKDFTERLNLMPIRITLQMGFRILSDIERQGRSHLSKGYPTPAVEVKDVNLDDLWEHISELWKLREKGNHEKARSLGPFTWPAVPGLQKLKEIVSFGTDLPIEKIYGAVQAILEEIGRENVATAAPLVVACALERLDYPYTHREEFWHVVNEMYHLSFFLKILSESPEGTQDVMQEATSLIVEGARVFSLQGGRRRSASEVSAIRQNLNTMYVYISTEFNDRVFTPIQHQRRSHADNGQVEEDLLLTGQVEEDLLVPEPQKAYIHNNEQVEEDLLDTGQVEEDLLVPEPQKAYIHNNEQVEEDLLSTGRQKVFKMEALEVATNNFHKDNKVGQGGFGAVYKGTTHHGKQIAVKKMSFTSDERSREFLKKQFENEKLLAEVQHRNLVNLLGSCEQESQGFLVYEYLPNKSLDKFLFEPENRKLLDWHKRYNIIQGIARGLQYLHEDSRVRIVHRDIKASNILLDEKLNPKIADFGTANLFPEDRTHVTATSAVGTFGYMPPEYVMTGKLSVRTDVYSFGIVLLELLTGEKISSDALNRLGWVWRSYKRKEVVQTIDPTIIETWNKEKGKVLRCIQVALLCIQENSSDRPTMSEVTAMLSTFESLSVPKKPPFQPSTRRSWF